MSEKTFITNNLNSVKMRVWFTKLVNFIREYYRTIDVFEYSSFEMSYKFDDGTSVHMSKNHRTNAVHVYEFDGVAVSTVIVTGSFMVAFDVFQTIVNNKQSTK